MLFNTHHRTPKTKTNKTLKTVLIICYGFMGAFFLFLAIASSIINKSIVPALIILIPIVLIAAFLIISTIDMNKACIEVNEHSITIVDYYFLHRKERTVLMSEIRKGEITLGYSFRVRGYRYRVMGCSYIVFRNANNKYLFKIINCPETHDYFSKHFEVQ